MDVTDQLQEIRIFLTDNRFIAVLEKVAAPFMTLIEGNSVASHEAAHDRTQGSRACAQQEMKVVRD